MEEIISTTKLSKSYGSLKALSNLNLKVAKGEVFGYLGPNGSGKTTTIRLLLGLIKPTSGGAKLFNLDSQNEKIAIHKRIAYVPGEATLWPALTGKETLYLLGKIHGEIDEKYLKVLIEKFQFDPNKKVRNYSKGNRQKINLIAAFMTRADLLIMDEPTSGLDPIMEQTFRECVVEAKGRGQTIFLSSHILEEVEALCDKVGILRSGKLIEVNTINQLKHLSALTVEATFDNDPPDVSKLEGVDDIKISGHNMTCQVHGEIAPILSIISNAHPKTLISRQPSLEELFLSIYGREDIELNDNINDL